MDFTIAERVYLLNALPKEGDIVTLRIVSDLLREIGFSEAELAQGRIEQAPEGVLWDTSLEFTKDIEIGPRAFRVCAVALTARSKAKKLTIPEIPLYERFCEAPAETDLRVVS